jgi:uridine phosphorylase
VTIPILDHPIEDAAVFTPEALVGAVQSQRGLSEIAVPEVCVLEFDGDLTDKLVASGTAEPYRSWACFHTPMFSFRLGDGTRCGIVPRTIGGPFAVLVAEQLFVSGARVVLGLTSAGRVSPTFPLPHVVVVDEAIRDEGTSYHYVLPSRSIRAPAGLADWLRAALVDLPLQVAKGRVWTTDAPYRETRAELESYAAEGVLAVEMQAASLFALARRKGFQIGVIAHVTNALDTPGEAFHKGPENADEQLLYALCRAAVAWIRSRGTGPG